MKAFLRPLRRRVPLVLLALALVSLASCRKDVTPIKTLLDDPSRFDNQEVRIAGEVTRGVGVLGYGAYQVQDDTGTLTVISQGGGAPREGAKVGVQGTFKAVYTLGSQSAAVLMETKRYTP